MRKIGKSSLIGKNLIKYRAVYAKVSQPKTFQKNFNYLCQVFTHVSYSQQRNKIPDNTDLTSTTAVYVIPCKY